MMRGDVVQMQCWEDGPTTTWMQREFSYGCSSGIGRFMGSSTRCSSAEEVGQGVLASTQVLVPYNQSDAQ